MCMIQTLNSSSHLMTKLVIVGALIAGYHYRAGLLDRLSKNETIQELRTNLKWLGNELRPMTEAEKASHAAYGEEQRRRTAELTKELGHSPHMRYVAPGDKDWKQAVKDHAELMKEFDR